jgi:hypothetical protein
MGQVVRSWSSEWRSQWPTAGRRSPDAVRRLVVTETVAWASGEVSGVLTRDGAVVALPRLGWG